MVVTRRLEQERDRIVKQVQTVPHHPHGAGPHAMVPGGEAPLEQPQRRLLLPPGGPEGFELQQFVVAVGIGEGFGGRQHLGGRPAPQLSLGTLAGVHLGQRQVGKQRVERGPLYHGRVDQRSRRIGDAVDAAILIVAERVAGRVLHVADQRVVPVDKIEAAIGADLQVAGTEIAVVRLDQVLPEVALDLRAVLDDFKVLDAEEADRVGVEVVALHLLGEVPRRNELGTRGGANVVLVVELRNLCHLRSVRQFDGVAEHPELISAGSVVDEGLPVSVVSNSPRIVDVELHDPLNLPRVWVESPHPAVRHPLRPPGGLHL